MTERRETALKMLRLNRAHAVLRNISRLFMRERSRKRILEESCRIAVEDGKLSMCWIGLVDETARMVKPVAYAGAVDGHLEHLQISHSESPVGSGTAIREVRNIICGDIEHDERMLHCREKALKLGLKSLAAFPLQTSAKVIGTINFYANEVDYFGADEIELYNELAKDISFALEMLENEESLLQTIPFGLKLVDEQGTVLFINTAMKNIAGHVAVDRTGILESIHVFDGRVFQISRIGIMYQGKKAMLEVFVDATEQRKLQNQFLQAQKIQSIGTLAGGIAHDFNNILGIIPAYSSLLERGFGDKNKIKESSTAITKAVDRGASLVRQILTFARQADVLFQPLNVSDFMLEIISMLEETFPKTIELRRNIKRNIPFVNADKTQMHQALLNLCGNARDAMPNGGILSIKAETFDSKSIRKSFPAANNERYVCISVSDTGTGIDQRAEHRIFDPYFTTKEHGKGTGLGLSVVYGMMQMHHGFVDMQSEAGKGTIFSLYLPVPFDTIRN